MPGVIPGSPFIGSKFLFSIDFSYRGHGSSHGGGARSLAPPGYGPGSDAVAL